MSEESAHKLLKKLRAINFPMDINLGDSPMGIAIVFNSLQAVRDCALPDYYHIVGNAIQRDWGNESIPIFINSSQITPQ